MIVIDMVTLKEGLPESIEIICPTCKKKTKLKKYRDRHFNKSIVGRHNGSCCEYGFALDVGAAIK
jgi:hypothetical protein